MVGRMRLRGVVKKLCDRGKGGLFGGRGWGGEADILDAPKKRKKIKEKNTWGHFNAWSRRGFFYFIFLPDLFY